MMNKGLYTLSLLTFFTLGAEEPHFFARGDIFYWNVREDGLDFAIKNNRPTNEHKGEGTQADRHAKVKNAHFDWDIGGRAGFGYRFNHDNWILSALWTHLHTDADQHVTVKTEKENLFITRVHPGGLGSEDAVVKSALSARSQIDLHYNIVDLELGRMTHVSDWICLKPLFGLRAGWINQDFDIHYHPVFLKDTFIHFSQSSKSFPEENVSLKNDFFGLGGRFGFDSDWYFCRGWSIYANANASLFWGFFDTDMKEKRHLNDHKVENIIDLSDDHHDTIANLELALGIKWQMPFSHDRYRLSLSLGWEQILWFSFNQLDKFTDYVNSGIIFKEHGNLNLSGVTLSSRFDF